VKRSSSLGRSASRPGLSRRALPFDPVKVASGDQKKRFPIGHTVRPHRRGDGIRGPY
jgi:hypothetical protein